MAAMEQSMIKKSTATLSQRISDDHDQKIHWIDSDEITCCLVDQISINYSETSPPSPQQQQNLYRGISSLSLPLAYKTRGANNSMLHWQREYLHYLVVKFSLCGIPVQWDLVERPSPPTWLHRRPYPTDKLSSSMSNAIYQEGVLFMKWNRIKRRYEMKIFGPRLQRTVTNQRHWKHQLGGAVQWQELREVIHLIKIYDVKARTSSHDTMQEGTQSIVPYDKNLPSSIASDTTPLANFPRYDRHACVIDGLSCNKENVQVVLLLQSTMGVVDFSVFASLMLQT